MILPASDTTSSGTLDERVYPVQDWRGDVVAVLASDGDPLAALEYEEYGTPIRTMRSDLDDDGGIDLDDFSILSAQFTTADCEAAHGVNGCTADLNRDNRVDSADVTIFNAGFGDTIGDRMGDLDASSKGRGYAGRHHLWMIDTSLVDKRNRVLASDEGRFTRRDPLGYVDGGNLYAYVRGMPVGYTDPMGLCARCFTQDTYQYTQPSWTLGGLDSIREGHRRNYFGGSGRPQPQDSRIPPFPGHNHIHDQRYESCERWARRIIESRMPWLQHMSECYQEVSESLRDCCFYKSRRWIRDSWSESDCFQEASRLARRCSRSPLYEECLQACVSLNDSLCDRECSNCSLGLDIFMSVLYEYCPLVCFLPPPFGQGLCAPCFISAFAAFTFCNACVLCRLANYIGCMSVCSEAIGA